MDLGSKSDQQPLAQGDPWWRARGVNSILCLGCRLVKRQFLLSSNGRQQQEVATLLLLAYTGLRWGEATALRVCDIDFDCRRLDVRRAFSDVGGRVILGTPKSHQSRTVPLPRFLAVEIAATVAGKHPDQLVCVADAPGWSPAEDAARDHGSCQRHHDPGPVRGRDGRRRAGVHTLDHYRRVLGDDHSLTLGSASNLAADLHALGEVQGERELDEDMARRKRRDG